MRRLLLILVLTIIAGQTFADNSTSATLLISVELAPRPVETIQWASASGSFPTSCEKLLQTGDNSESRHCQDHATTYSWQRHGDDLKLVIAPI